MILKAKLPEDWREIVAALPDRVGRNKIAAALSIAAPTFDVMRLNHAEFSDAVEPKMFAKRQRRVNKPPVTPTTFKERRDMVIELLEGTRVKSFKRLMLIELLDDLLAKVASISKLEETERQLRARIAELERGDLGPSLNRERARNELLASENAKQLREINTLRSRLPTSTHRPPTPHGG